MTNLSQFYLMSNKAVLATEVLGAVSTRNSSASVIGAFWPGHGRSLSDIIYDKLKIGIIQYFFSQR